MPKNTQHLTFKTLDEALAAYRAVSDFVSEANRPYLKRLYSEAISRSKIHIDEATMDEDARQFLGEVNAAL